MDKGLIAADSKVRPKAPGMKYRHYAPKADLAIVEGSAGSCGCKDQSACSRGESAW